MKSNDKLESTIVDIARELRISPATVSRALNDHPKISHRTKERVREKALEMGYRRNKLASGLRNNRTYTIGMIVPRISMFFHAEVITIVQNLLHRQGYNLIICQSNDSRELEVDLASALYSSRVDGVLVASTLYTTDYSHFDVFVQKGIPLVFYDRVPVDFYPAQMVKGDEYRGGYLAGEHLAEAGCKNIAAIFGLLGCCLYKGRYAGFKAALKAHKLALKKDQVFFHELTHENALATLDKLFSSKPYPDGLFTANDTSALAVLEFARENKIRIPGDLKLIGYSNDPRAASVTPAITTVDQFPGEVARQLVAALNKLLDNRSKKIMEKPEALVTPVALIKRMTT
ncbi:LacI family transcriptional regulator [Anseongella ginsenosidimutans]|uniref:LacI family transcriptional regulator n=1 Tax=Anseongella ginsenosidimutans TaxID=496056 RepID=A0A4R3KPC3_9SPHI|nr:LacI family DNA-binding transcriptional regulator [Anseongella ginsenosidimutans]QEC52597.1 LacI family transcriptional regulator [Anseongella ginsenosidimutans]TCS86518.1 LacI family transcriptional regulator [Anseongella ginsenosidimutans]